MYIAFFVMFSGVVADSHIEQPVPFQVASLLNLKTNQANHGNLLLRENDAASTGDFRGVCELLTDNTAKVACKMLGYSDGIASTEDGEFGSTFFPKYKSIKCTTGTEDSLYDSTCTKTPTDTAAECAGGLKGAGIKCGKAECFTGGYEMITDSKRSTSYVSGTNWKCDKTGVASVSSDWKGADKWYRFDGSAGSILAQDSSKKGSCGTNVNGWSPNVFTGVAIGATENLALCFGATNDARGTCFAKASGEVTNCGTFFVYKLPEAPGCNMRYCGATA